EEIGTGDRAAMTVSLARIGVFWSAGGVAGPTEAFASSGKHVAAATWTEALARYGRLSHLDIFTPFDQLQRSRQQFAGLPAAVDGGATTQFLPETELASRFRHHPYEA